MIAFDASSSSERMGNGIYANDGVTISAPLDLTVGKKSAAENGLVYGIYAQSGAISLSGADKTITATGGTQNAYGVYNKADASSTAADNGNIGISGKLTVNLSGGSNYNRGISSQGGVITLDGATVKIPGSYYYGIFNNNGNVVIKNNSGVELTSTISDGEGICAYDGGNLTIENSTVKVSAKGYAANLNRGKLSIKDSTVELTKASAHHLVVNTSDAVTNTIDLSGGGSVTLTASGKQTDSMIGGGVTLGPSTKLEKGHHYDYGSYENFDGLYDEASNTTVLQFVHEAPAANPAKPSISVSGTYTYTGSAQTATVSGYDSATMNITGNVGTNAGNYTVSVTSKTGQWADGTTDAVTADWSIQKANPTYEVPTGLEGTKGNALSTVTLPDGFTWADGATVMSTTGNQTFPATFTPDDTDNYNVVKNISVTVNVKEVSVFRIYVTNGKATDGAGNTLLAVPEGAEVIFTANEPETGKQFKEWTGLDGVEFVDGTSKTSSTAKIKMPARAVTATAVYEDAPNANPAKPTISVSGTYTYTGSAQTATVSGYDSATMNITGNVETNAGNYTVSVTSKTGQWADGTTDAVTADWSIQKANPTYEVPTGLEGTKGKTLSTVTLPDGFTWADGATVMSTTGNQTFPATFTPDDTDNYNVVNNISVTVNVKEATPTTYEVTVTNGTGGGNYEEGATVTITANAAPADKVFDKWEVVSGSITLADVTSATTTFTMPAGAVSVEATYKDKPVTTYTVTVNDSYASTTGAGEYAVGETVNISAGSRSGYTFDGWTSDDVTIANASNKNASFVMPDDDVTVTAHWTRNAVPVTPTEPSTYTIKVEKTDNGDVTVSHKSASKGTTVTITVEPDEGYTLETLKVLDKDGDKVKFTEKKGKYTFTMPASKVTVKGKFVEEAPEQIFADVPVDAYCYEAVKWAAEKGITGGVGNGLFAPNQPCTRAQIVTFLWRAAGSPAPKNMSSFADVPADAFYAKAVAWAVENGITGGTGDGKFSPDATCTRAQAVTFLYRASGSPAVSSKAEFSDVSSTAFYADAVAWAAKKGITTGIGGGLFGADNDCTRAQIVTFLYRSVK